MPASGRKTVYIHIHIHMRHRKILEELNHQFKRSPWESGHISTAYPPKCITWLLATCEVSKPSRTSKGQPKPLGADSLSRNQVAAGRCKYSLSSTSIAPKHFESSALGWLCQLPHIGLLEVPQTHKYLETKDCILLYRHRDGSRIFFN